ncbi:hypothetical protein [Rhodococcus sp. HS-D2]|uniref:hypothetical protein n=1 Tax=Rhodococcus sp. HS-D2 TaxID=1384636 RepID=UPI0007D9BC0D|nr:hypothetical protein [Rhodococcus sp. HS-D2]
MGAVIFVICVIILPIFSIWAGIKLGKKLELKQAEWDIKETRRVSDLYQRAARNVDNREEQREMKRRQREMRRQIDDENGETPPWELR